MFDEHVKSQNLAQSRKARKVNLINYPTAPAAGFPPCWVVADCEA